MISKCSEGPMRSKNRFVGVVGLVELGARLQVCCSSIPDVFMGLVVSVQLALALKGYDTDVTGVFP
jgi:hypothetical protein